MEKQVAKTFNDKVENYIKSEDDREKLYISLAKYQQSRDLQSLMNDLQELLNEPKRLHLYDYIKSLIPVKHQIEYDQLCPDRPQQKLRAIRLKRRTNEGLGFALRGGLEHGIGVYVSHVVPESQAQREGLMVGDEVIRVNGYTIKEAIHDEVLNLIKAKRHLVLKVRYVGLIPIKEFSNQPLSWKRVPSKKPTAQSSDTTLSRSSKQGQGQKVNVHFNVPIGAGLGCSICSGPRHQPGIFILSIKPGGLTEEAGLEVGDQIINVNGTSFHNITHSQAVVAMKSSRQLNITLKKYSGLDVVRPSRPPSVFEMDISGPDHQGSRPHSGYEMEARVPDHTNANMQRYRMSEDNTDSSTTAPPEWESPLLNQSSPVNVHMDGNSRHLSITRDIQSDDSGYNNSANSEMAASDSGGNSNSFTAAASALLQSRAAKLKQMDDERQRLPAPPPPPLPPHATVTPTTSMTSGNTSMRMRPPAPPPPPPLTICSVNDNSSTSKQLSPRKINCSSPTYLGANTERTPNFKMTKPVLLSPVHSSHVDKSTSNQKLLEEEMVQDNFNPYILFTSEEVDGRRIKLVNLTKNYSSDLGLIIEKKRSRIMVAEIYEGGALHRNGGVHVGDQLMLVDGNSLLDVSQQRAQSLISAAFRSNKSVLQLVVAKAPRMFQDDEITQF